MAIASVLLSTFMEDVAIASSDPVDLELSTLLQTFSENPFAAYLTLYAPMRTIFAQEYGALSQQPTFLPIHLPSSIPPILCSRFL